VLTSVKPSHFQQPNSLSTGQRQAISRWMNKRGYVLLANHAAYLLKTVWVAIDEKQDGSTDYLPTFASIGNKRGTIGVGCSLLFAWSRMVYNAPIMIIECAAFCAFIWPLCRFVGRARRRG
jgi:hypothetical protein